MRLLRIRAEHFRGIGSLDWIDLDSDLVLFYGPNGFGKTSVAEAIEWLFYGTTERRSRGELLNSLEYRGSYRNVHAPSEATTIVTAEVILADGSTHTLQRSLAVGRGSDDRGSTLTIDGQADTFDAINLSITDSYYPVIVQHGLQDFIHARPIDRRSEISSALGLERLLNLKSSIEQARNDFRTTPPEAVVNARVGLNTALTTMQAYDALTDLNTRWSSSQFSLPTDGEALIELGRGLLDAPELELEGALGEIQAARTAKAEAVFDKASISPPTNLDEHLEAIETDRTAIATALDTARTAVESFLITASATFRTELLSFWAEGLELTKEMPDGNSRCASSSRCQMRRRKS